MAIDNDLDAVADSIMESMGDDDAAETVLDALDGDGADETVDKPAQQDNATDDQKADRIMSADDAKTKDAAKAVEAPPAHIEPPISWKADAKERFKALTPELQQYVVERESERERGTQQAAKEQLDAKKAYDAEVAKAAAERKAYADNLSAVINVAMTANPKLAEWQKRDWEQYAKENPLEVQSEWFAYNKAMASINQAQAERARVMELDRVAQEQTLNAQRLKAHETLTSKLDFWADTEKRKAFQTELRDWAKADGWDDAEINGIEDPRAMLMARKAMMYDKLMAEQSKIAEKKKPLPTGKVLTTQATASNGDKNPQADKLRRVAARTGRTEDQAAAILASL